MTREEATSAAGRAGPPEGRPPREPDATAPERVPGPTAVLRRVSISGRPMRSPPIPRNNLGDTCCKAIPLGRGTRTLTPGVGDGFGEVGAPSPIPGAG